MATLRAIKNRISSIRNTQQITKAMKMVAAARLRRAQDNILNLRPYAYELRDLLAHLTSVSQDIAGIPLMEKRPVEKVLCVVVTSDRGLCGSFNGNIIRQTGARLRQYENTEAALYPIGKKGYEFFRRRETIEKYKHSFFNSLIFEDALEISRDLVSFYTSKQFDRIEIIYNEFKSAIQQKVIVEQFLPFVPDPEMEDSRSEVDFIYEPDKRGILNEVIPRDLNIQIWRVLLESFAAEQGARMTAMENATDNASELIEKLTIFYNRSRQAAITTEISEIVGGAEALKES